MRYQILSSWCRCFLDTSSLVLLFLCLCVWYPFPTTTVPISGVSSRCTSMRWVKSIQLLTFFQPLVICSCVHHQLVRKVTQQKKWFSDKLVSWGPQWTLISRQGKVEYQWKNWTPAWRRSKLLSTQLCFPLFFFPPSSFFSSFPHLRSPISCCLTSYLLPRVLSLHQR